MQEFCLTSSHIIFSKNWTQTGFASASFVVFNMQHKNLGLSQEFWLSVFFFYIQYLLKLCITE
jgi:hypothetical protein